MAGSSAGVRLTTDGTQLRIDLRFFLGSWWGSLGGSGGGVSENGVSGRLGRFGRGGLLASVCARP